MTSPFGCDTCGSIPASYCNGIRKCDECLTKEAIEESKKRCCVDCGETETFTKIKRYQGMLLCQTCIDEREFDDEDPSEWEDLHEEEYHGQRGSF